MNQFPLLLIASAVLLLQILSVQPEGFIVSDSSYGKIHTLAELPQAKKQTSHLYGSTLVAAASDSMFASVVFTGDIMMGRHVEVLMNRNGSAYPFSGLALASLGEKPAIVGNFESAILERHIPTPAYNLRFATKKEHLTGLQEAGFTHVSLANNHSFDYGTQGYLYAQMALYSYGIQSFGFKPDAVLESISFLDTPVGTIALVGFDDSGLGLDIQAAQAALQTVSNYSELQFVSIHWGEEYKLTHSNRQQQVAAALVTAGADLVVGHHPHVVQDIAVIDGVPVFYSLGNYIFDQYFSKDVQEGLVLVMTLDTTTSIRLVPVTSIGTLSQPHEIQGDIKNLFLDTLAAKSDESVRTNIQKGYIYLFNEVATSPKIAMIAE